MKKEQRYETRRRATVSIPIDIFQRMEEARSGLRYEHNEMSYSRSDFFLFLFKYWENNKK